MNVYLHYDQAALDRAFDQTQWAPNMMQVVGRWGTWSNETRAETSKIRTLRYGEGANENLELFPSSESNAPLVVFIHGGEWKRRDNLSGAFPAPTFLKRGFAYANLNFEAIPAVRIPEMVDQVRRAVLWIYANAGELGINRKRIYLLGHSSGAHMAAVLGTTDWKAFGIPPNVFAGIFCFSGVYDLEPVLISMRREWVKLNHTEMMELSPIHAAQNAVADFTVIFGGSESPEFKRQAAEFDGRLKAMGRASKLWEIAGHNHFEVLDKLRDPDSEISRHVLLSLQKKACAEIV